MRRSARPSIDAVYVPFRVPFDTLGQFMEDVPRLGIRGLSITIPHKEADRANTSPRSTPAVKGIGAVNTVLFQDGEVLGYNTDVQGGDGLPGKLPWAVRLRRESPARSRTKKYLCSVQAVWPGPSCTGCSGAERKRRSPAARGRAAQYLADTFGGRCVEWPARHIGDAEIIVNCTPVGMHPNVDESPFNKSHLKPSMIVFDTVYNPESTLLLKEARSHGCRIVTGR